MDLSDLIFLILTRGPFVLPLLYVLTILLRVACHFAGVEIPALGRAFFTASSTAVLSATATLVLLARLGPIDMSSAGLFVFFLTLLLSLLVNMALATEIYHLLLGISYNQALAVWLIQAVSFVAFIVVAGCLVGVPLALLFN